MSIEEQPVTEHLDALAWTGLTKRQRRKRRRPTPSPQPEKQPGERPAELRPDRPPSPFVPDRAQLSTMSAAEIAEHYGLGPWDTGASAVQVALLTQRVITLTSHLREHPKDFATERGLRKVLGRRKRLLQYVYDTDVDEYRTLVRSIPDLERFHDRRP